MKIEFTSLRPDAADVVAFALTKESFEGFDFPVDHPDQLIETAKLARFDGSAGQSFLLIAPVGGRMVRIVLVGAGETATEQQKAGGIIIAKVQTSGAKSIAIHGANLEGTVAGRNRFWRAAKKLANGQVFHHKAEETAS